MFFENEIFCSLCVFVGSLDSNPHEFQSLQLCRRLDIAGRPLSTGHGDHMVSLGCRGQLSSVGPDWLEIGIGENRASSGYVAAFSTRFEKQQFTSIPKQLSRVCWAHIPNIRKSQKFFSRFAQLERTKACLPVSGLPRFFPNKTPY